MDMKRAPLWTELHYKILNLLLKTNGMPAEDSTQSCVFAHSEVLDKIGQLQDEDIDAVIVTPTLGPIQSEDTLLSFALSSGRQVVFQALLDRGADPRRLVPDKRTQAQGAKIPILHRLVQEGKPLAWAEHCLKQIRRPHVNNDEARENAVKEFLGCKALRTGLTALMHAVHCQDESYCEWLIMQGANLDEVNTMQDGKLGSTTAFDLASIMGERKLALMLSRAGAQKSMLGKLLERSCIHC